MTTEADDPSRVQAFEAMHAACREKVHNFCLRMVLNQAVAEDMVQETFARAFAAFGSFHGQSAPSTWLCSIAHHVCIDHLRRQGLWQRVLPVLRRCLPWQEPSPLERSVVGPPRGPGHPGGDEAPLPLPPGPAPVRGTGLRGTGPGVCHHAPAVSASCSRVLARRPSPLRAGRESSMDCSEFRDCLSWYLDSELDEARLRTFEAHRDACVACREILETHVRLERVMHDIPVDVPRHRAHARPLPPWRVPWLAPALACALMLLVTIFLVMGRGGDGRIASSPAPPSSAAAGRQPSPGEAPAAVVHEVRVGDSTYQVSVEGDATQLLSCSVSEGPGRPVEVVP